MPKPTKEEINAYIADVVGDDSTAAWMRALAQHESKYDTEARAGDKEQSSRGLFQIRPKFAKDYGVTDVDDWQDQVRGVAGWIKKRGLDLSTPEGQNAAYLVYNQGLAGSKKILAAASGQGDLPDYIVDAMANQGAGRGLSGSHSEVAQAFIERQAKRFSSNYKSANKSDIAPGMGVEMIDRLRKEQRYDPIRPKVEFQDTLVMPATKTEQLAVDAVGRALDESALSITGSVMKPSEPYGPDNARPVPDLAKRLQALYDAGYADVYSTDPMNDGSVKYGVYIPGSGLGGAMEEGVTAAASPHARIPVGGQAVRVAAKDATGTAVPAGFKPISSPPAKVDWSAAGGGPAKNLDPRLNTPPGWRPITSDPVTIPRSEFDQARARWIKPKGDR